MTDSGSVASTERMRDFWDRKARENAVGDGTQFCMVHARKR
jgi:hypothetical protein